MKCRPRSSPPRLLSLRYLIFCRVDTEKPRVNPPPFFFWWGGRVSCESFSFPTSSQDVSLFPHAGMYSGYCGHVASGRGCTTAAQALAAPAELAHSSIQGSEAGAGILRVSVGAQAHLRCRPTQRVTPLPFPPSGNGPAHRKWLSTISFLAFLGSPVTNRVLLTCQRNTQ